MSGKVMSVNTSTKKGEAKKPVNHQGASLREDWGIEGDVHAGPGEKQVSLLAWESVQAQLALMREKGVKCPKAEELTSRTGETGTPEGPLGVPNMTRTSSTPATTRRTSRCRASRSTR